MTEKRNVCHFVFLLLAALTSFTGALEVKYAQLGGTATFKPPRLDPSRKYYVYWQLESRQPEDKPLAWRNPLGGEGKSSEEQWKDRLSLSDDSSLIIKDIRETDFKTFVFKRIDGDNEALTTYRLLKLAVIANPSTPLLPGDSLSLSCDAETFHGARDPEIHWLNPSGEKVKKGPGPMTLKVTSRDSGQWICVVNKEEAKVSVTVLDLSPAPSHPQYTSESWPLTVPCSLPTRDAWKQIKEKDVQEVHWDFVPKSGSSQRLFSLSPGDPPTWKPGQNRELRPVPDPTKGNLSLTRSRGSEEDRGNYVCTMKFKNGVSLNRSVHVEVLQITSSPGTELISGQQLNLTCSLGQPKPPDLQLKWVPPPQSSPSSLTSDLGHFTIPEVGTGDGGKWRCELWRSDALLTSAELTLKIEPKLSSWMLVVICSVTVIVILLLILAFIVYRRRQQRMTPLRRRLCKCKTPKPKGFYRT